MATLERTTPIARANYPAGSLRFDLWIAFVGLWFIVGLFVDGTAHNHGAVDDTFFTPYHALLYSGVLAAGITLAYTQYRNVSRGYAFTRALPRGYALSLIGAILFFAAGGFDMVWHEMFGFEASLEALISPAHLLLATAGLLILTGPLRSMWQRTHLAPTWATMLPMILTFTLLLSVVTFFLQFAYAFTSPWGYTGSPSPRWLFNVLGVASIIIPAAVIMTALLFMVRRWRLPFGTITFILTLNTFGMMVLQFEDNANSFHLMLAPVIAGLVGDLILRYMPATRANPVGLRVFGFVVPFVLFLAFFALLITAHGTWWRIHMWLGSCFFAGVTGFILSYLVYPPALPEDPFEAAA